MEARAPAVVAVVITTAPGPGLEATLASLVAQDYSALGILVLAHGDPEAAARVAAVAPQAFVRVLEENRGFGAACNEASLMTQGAAFYLLCHDDVRLDPDAVSRMVEGAFRTNAGIVTPKVVTYEDPLVLLHVGQTCDRFGVVQERIEPGEIDHGQQDLERDVFVAPGGVTLVRADLFAALRGFDPLIPALGEDLDLCWRAQVAGARIVVVPSARVAHRETVLTAERTVTAIGTRRASRQDLLRRHQLLVVATGWSWRSLWVVLPLLAALDAVEVVVALVGRDTDRAGAILGAWRWLAFHRRRVRDRRRLRREVAVLADGDLRQLQVGGAPRLKRFVTTLIREGLDAARGILPAPEGEPPSLAEPAEPGSGVGFAAAFSEAEEFDEFAGALDEGGRRGQRLLTSFRSQALVIAALALAWTIGARNLVAMHLPLVGRLAPLDSWWGSWRHLFASWSPVGLGSGAPGAPGYGVLALAGTFVAGRMGILPRIALIFAAPIGSIGVARLLKGRVSNRARVVASFLYLAAPLGLDMVAQGRIDVLAVVAGLPFLTRRLLSLAEVDGYATASASVPFGQRGWRATPAGQRMVAAMLAAVLIALAPPVIVDLVIVALALWLARQLGRLGPARPWSALGLVLGRVVLLLAPLVVTTLLGGRQGLQLLGLARGPWSTPSFATLARAADGAFGAGWWGYLLPAAAVLGYAITRAERRQLADPVAAAAALSLIVAALSARHWMGPFTPDLDVLLALYALCLATLVGLGISSLERDLRQVGFGWRQLSAGAVALLATATVVPFVGALGSGRFDLPTSSTAQSLSALAPSGAGAYRVLWLGDPSVLPLAGWSVAPGLAVATTLDGLPGGNSLFATADAGPSDRLIHDVALALEGRTVHLGSLLATAGVSSLVVMNSAAPSIAGVQSAPVDPVPSTLTASLANQTDLALELTTPDVLVYGDALYRGTVTVAAPSGHVGALAPDAGTFAAGPVAAGDQVSVGLAPASDFTLSLGAGHATRSLVDGWAPTFTLGSDTPAGTTAQVRLSAWPFNGLLAGATLLVWLFGALGFGRLGGLGALGAGAARRRGAARHARGERG